MKFSIFGIRIYISFLSVALLTLAMVLSCGDNHMIPVCIMCSAIHEVGHLVFISKFSGKPSSVSFYPCEVRIVCDCSENTSFQDIIINISGVFFNFLTGTLFYLLYSITGSKVLFDFFVCSFCIGAFNILPIKGLDGASTLESILLLRSSARIAERIINILTVVFLIPIAVIGFLILFLSKNNYSMLFIAVYFTINILSKEMR